MSFAGAVSGQGSHRRWAGSGAPVIGVLVLTIAYIVTYLHDPARPGVNAAYPLGWNGWFDQGNYHKSAVSLFNGALGRDRHWYPLGYSLTGALFAGVMPAQCFLVPDLICLLACMFGFQAFCASVGVGSIVAVLLFLAGTFSSEILRHVWCQPWNTTLSAALIWWLLALSARSGGFGTPGREQLRLAGIGAISACIVETRPSDALLVIICGLMMLLMRLGARRPIVKLMPAVTAGVAVLAVPYLALHLAIYGLQPTPYMRLSAGIGFDATALWWKSYLLLIDPRPWLPDGAGLLHRFPWLVAGFAGMISVPFLRSERRTPLLLLGVLIAASWASFLAYNDLQPSGLWRFENVHYFKWTFPGLLLLGWVMVRNLLGAHRLPIIACCLAVVLPSAIHLEPKQADERAPAWMIQIRQPQPPFFETYFGSLVLKMGSTTLVNTRDFRALPDAGGFRIILYRRAVSGTLRLLSRVHGISSRDDLSAVRWRISPRFGFPCWLSSLACDRSRGQGI